MLFNFHYLLMNKNSIILIVLFPVLVLLQVLIFNHIILFNFAVPFIFIYFIIRLPIGLNKNILFTLSFLLGFIVDIFSDTPGVNSLSSLILSAVKTPIFYAYVPRDDKTKYIVPTIESLGWQNNSKYLLTMSAVFCFCCFSIEFFSYASIRNIALLTLGSTIITFCLLYGVDCLLPSGKSAYSS